MQTLWRHDTHWFFEQQDSHGVWHTVADANLLAAQATLGHKTIESLNLQWQFVRTEILAYNSWVGERGNSFDRWPRHASHNAARWVARYLAHRDEIIGFNAEPEQANEIPLNVRNETFGVVGPCEGMAKPWSKPKALERFLDRVEQARGQLGLMALPVENGWYTLEGKPAYNQPLGAMDRLSGHDVLRIQGTARSLLRPTPNSTRLLFAVKM